MILSHAHAIPACADVMQLSVYEERSFIVDGERLEEWIASEHELDDLDVEMGWITSDPLDMLSSVEHEEGELPS